MQLHANLREKQEEKPRLATNFYLKKKGKKKENQW